MAGSFSQDFIDKVLQASDIVSIISQHTSLTKRGPRYTGLCPFHTEKSPSFSVTAERQLYYCFGCGAGGNLITFVTEMHKYTFPEAIEFLANKAGIPIEYVKGHEQNTGNYQKKKVLYQMHKDAANFYYLMLRKNQPASEYLKKRGLSEATLKTFAVGYAPNTRDALYRHLKTKGYTDTQLLDSSLVRKSDSGSFYDYFRNRVMFPIQDTADNVVAFGGRVLDNAKPKYLNSPETGIFYKHNMLFNLNRAKNELKTEPIIITEGYMDVISLYDKGIKSACATLGTALSKDHAKLMLRYTPDVALCYDGDEAGKNAALRGLDILEDAGIVPKVIALDGIDPDEYVTKYGAQAFRELAAGGVYSTDFKIGLLKEKYDLGDIVQRASFIKQACAAVARLNDEIKWDYYVKQLSALTETDPAVIKNQIYKSGDAAPELRAEEENFNQNPQSAAELMQTAVLKYIMEDFSNYDRFRAGGGGAHLFLDDKYRELYQQIEELYAEDELIDIFKGIVYNSRIAYATARIESLEEGIGQHQLNEYLRALAANFYEDRLRRIKSEIEGAEKSDGADSAALLKEFGYLKQRLLELKSGGATH